MINPPSLNYPDIGDLGEELVVRWLKSTGWNILHRRFACRWGEIDIIAEYHGSIDLPILAFVEVKTRSAGNWDSGGRNAINLKKQANLWRTAEIFLVKYPAKADYACRFDVAIVHSQKILIDLQDTIGDKESLFSLSKLGYNFYLQEYISAAFDR